MRKSGIFVFIILTTLVLALPTQAMDLAKLNLKVQLVAATVAPATSVSSLVPLAKMQGDKDENGFRKTLILAGSESALNTISAICLTVVLSRAEVEGRPPGRDRIMWASAAAAIFSLNLNAYELFTLRVREELSERLEESRFAAIILSTLSAFSNVVQLGLAMHYRPS